MPEAAVDKNHLAAAREYQIGAAGQVAAVQTVTVAEPVQQATNDMLWLAMLCPYASHALASSLGRQRVHSTPTLIMV